MQKQTSYQASTNQTGLLYLVPTPIGNLEDMTFRAIRILKEVQLILAEDTRNSIKLLNHFDIKTSMKSFHEFSTSADLAYYVSLLEDGQDLALISDAGMPMINDPGHPLVQAALEREISVVALPGANAALTALVASGLDCQQFTYYGFFPRATSEQEAVLKLVANRKQTAIFYESPFRVKKAIQAINKYLGGNRQIVLARELTKRYEEFLRGSAEELLSYLNENDIKGECVLMIAGGDSDRLELEEDLSEVLSLPYKEQVELCIEEMGLTSKDAIKEVARRNEVKKQVVYQAYHDLV